MADIARPFSAFNFEVQIEVPGLGGTALCEGQFSECDGLEQNMEVKTIREGGNNTSQIRLIGAVTYGTLTLKRGMTSQSFDLWDWFDAQQHATPRELRSDYRGNVMIVAKGTDRKEHARYILRRCLLTKLKAPPMNAKDGLVAVEELQLSYQSMSIEVPGAGNA
ncbi:MAG TPA: phage tail protein [Vicinamibacterales bacterium]|nr:phage tail protein [Vicinamibacterales bacterium]